MFGFNAVFLITELRKATLPIFFDMMVCEFNQPAAKGPGVKANFKEVGHSQTVPNVAIVLVTVHFLSFIMHTFCGCLCLTELQSLVFIRAPH